MNNTYYFVYGNHGPAPSQLEDLYGMFSSAIRVSLGKELVATEWPVPNATNLLIECFSDDNLEPFLRVKEEAPKTRYIMVATEYVTGRTFNKFVLDLNNKSTEKDEKTAGVKPYATNLPKWRQAVGVYVPRIVPLGLRRGLNEVCPGPYRSLRSLYRRAFGRPLAVNELYSNLRYWKARYSVFERAMEMAEQLWVLSEHQFEGYRNALPSADIWQFPILPYEKVSEPAWDPSVVRRDFLFTGTLSRHRLEVIEQISARGFNVTLGPAVLPAFLRESFLRESKICLHLRPHARWPYPSNMRLHSLLLRGKAVVSQSSDRLCAQSRYVREIEPSEFVEGAIEFATREEPLRFGQRMKNRYYEETSEERKAALKEFKQRILNH